MSFNKAMLAFLLVSGSIMANEAIESTQVAPAKPSFFQYHFDCMVQSFKAKFQPAALTLTQDETPSVTVDPIDNSKASNETSDSDQDTTVNSGQDETLDSTQGENSNSDQGGTLDSDQGKSSSTEQPTQVNKTMLEKASDFVNAAQGYAVSGYNVTADYAQAGYQATVIDHPYMTMTAGSVLVLAAVASYVYASELNEELN